MRGDPRADLGHTADVILLSLLGNALGIPQKSWRLCVCVGGGGSVLLTQNCINDGRWVDFVLYLLFYNK